MKTGRNDYEAKDREDWVLDHPGQIVITVAQIVNTFFIFN